MWLAITLACQQPSTPGGYRPEDSSETSPPLPTVEEPEEPDEEEPHEEEAPGDEVFDSGRLHTVEIEISPADLEVIDPASPGRDPEVRVPCRFTYDGLSIEQVGIRVKGSIGSTDAIAGKPGWSVKIDEFVPDLRLDGLDKLTLNNANQDPTFLAEPLGYEVYRRMGLPAPRTAFAVITLNGETKGLYVVREAYDGDTLRRVFGEDGDGGNLYEGQVADFAVPAQVDDLELDDEDEGRTREDAVALAQAIARSTLASLADDLEPLLDVDGFVRAFAVDVGVAHLDGYFQGTNNYYVYHHPLTDRFVHLPHGMDQLFLMDPDPFDLGRRNIYGNPTSDLGKRILESPELRAAYEAALEAVVEVMATAELEPFLLAISEPVAAEAPPSIDREVRALQRGVSISLDALERRRAALSLDLAR